MWGTSLKRWVTGLAAVGLLTAVAACDDSISPDEARLTLLLTDAPGAGIESAWIEITEIYLQGQAPGEQGQLQLFEGSTGLIELTDLVGKTVELVSERTIPAGTYAQLRVVIGDALIETTDEHVYVKSGAHPEGKSTDGTLICPSCTETGIKVNLPGGAVRVEGESEILVLDFDVSQSYGLDAGLSGDWVMNPVINGSDFELSGSIAGSVVVAEGVSLPACGGLEAPLSEFVPLAIAGELSKSGTVGADGEFVISFLEPGDYDLDYEGVVTFDNGESLSFTASHPAGVSVATGAMASADFTVTGASCSL